MSEKVQEMKQWHVNQKCFFGVMIGTIVEIDLNHVCPILWRLDQNEAIEWRFYANGEICNSILHKKLVPANVT